MRGEPNRCAAPKTHFWRRVLGPLLVASAGVLAAPTAHSGPKDRDKTAVVGKVDIETAEQLYSALDYEQAAAVAERLLKKGRLTHDHLVRAYRVLALTYATLDNEQGAKEAFYQLLICDPDFQADPNLGPKVNTPFIEARGKFRSLPGKPRLEATPGVSRTGGTIKVTARDPSNTVKRVTVGYRWSVNGDFTLRDATPGETSTVEVSAPPKGRARLDYYAVALDDHDNAVLEVGDSQAPKTIFVEGTEAPPTGGKKEGGSIFASPLFWIISGTLVAGGGTALFFALRPQDPPTRALLSPVILCGNERCN